MKKKYIVGILCIFWMLFIFYMSAQVADDSQAMSNEVIYLISSIFHLGLEDSMSIWSAISFIIRKMAHMGEYAILAILFYLYGCEAGWKDVWLYAFIGATIYACTDEFHQLYVIGRSGEIRDVLVDTIGAMIGLGIFYWIKKGVIYLKHRKEE